MSGISDGDIDEESFRKSADIMHKLRDLGLRSSAGTPATWFCVNGTTEGPFLVEAWTDEAGTKNLPGALVAMSIIDNAGDVTVARRTGDAQGPQSWQISILPEKFNDDALNLWVSSAPALPANGSAAKGKTAPEIGDRMADGTVYAGVSPDTGKAMYATPADAPLTMKWEDAMKHAAKLDAHGHQDWRVPTKGELNVLWENRDKGALRGTFNVTGSPPAGRYCSSTEDYYVILAWDQHFSDGTQHWLLKDTESSLRLVR